MAGSTVDEIKARLDAADLIGQYVPLKKAGRTFKGLCPFHGEKTPSFVVWPETGTWRCFGCGEGGDVFTFVEKRENLEFGEALRLLAGKAGVELPSHETQAPEEQQAEDRLRELISRTELYFRAALAGAAGEAARTYLTNRGVTPESVDRFALGWAPQAGLLAHLQQSGFTLAEAVEAGVAGQREDGNPYDFLRQRVIFPIRDPQGRTIAFGGRTLGDQQPKYLNGPQTRFFDKGASLFALDLARAAIRQIGTAVIVEGYMDALIAHQHGFSNVVATLGTAFTERHLELLGRRASEIIFALDADSAGQAATMRGLEVAQNAPADAVVPVPLPGVRGLVRFQAIRKTQFKVLTLPTGLDPDDLVRRDANEWARLVSEATPVVDFVLNRLGERHDLSSAAGKREAVQEAMAVLRDLVDPIEREHYLQRLAGLVGLDTSALRQALVALRPRTVKAGSGPAADDRASLPEAYALALQYLVGPGPAGLRSEDVASPEGRALLARIDAADPADRSEPSYAVLVESLDPALRPAAAEVSTWLGRLAATAEDQRRRELEVASLKLRQQRLKAQHQEVLALLSDDEEPRSERPAALLTAIAQQLRQIDAALASLNGVGSMVWRSRQVGEVLGA